MLTTVPAAIARAGRAVTLRHRNSMHCTVWRKRLLREPDGPDASLGSVPNIGGLGVLDGEDEADYEYEVVGDAKILFTGIWQGDGANWNDADTGPNYNQAPVEALIEFVVETADYVRKPDQIMVEPGGGIVLPFEVIGESSSVNIPPYVRRFILAARSDATVGIG